MRLVRIPDFWLCCCVSNVSIYVQSPTLLCVRHCKVLLTPFESDSVSVADFRARYEEFIAKHNLVEFPITPRTMERYSSKMVRKGTS